MNEGSPQVMSKNTRVITKLLTLFFMLGLLLFYSCTNTSSDKNDESKASNNFNSTAQECNQTAAISFVDGLFEKGNYLSYDSTQFTGHFKEFKFLNTPLLNKLLPDYCFYSTIFLGPDYEYYKVETVLAYSKNTSKKSLLLHSPVFTEESEDFMNLFSGLRVADTIQGELLAKEITSIFADITYGGHYNKLINLKEKKVISFELWHGDLSWSIYDFHFDSTNKLIQINAAHGVGREKMEDDYKRQ
jgi:hypothetical protein